MLLGLRSVGVSILIGSLAALLGSRAGFLGGRLAGASAVANAITGGAVLALQLLEMLTLKRGELASFRKRCEVNE